MTVLGTPAYMAPDGQATEQSDLYSLGCVLYETFAGAPPFAGETPQQLMLQHLRDAPNLQSLPPAARKPVGWLLEKDPRHRPANAIALLAVLQGTSSTPRKTVVGRRPIAVGAVVGLLGLAALGAIATMRLRGGNDDGEDDNPDKGAAVLPAETAATPTRTPTRGSATEPGVTPRPSTPVEPTGSPSVVATATSPPTPPTATPSPTQPAVPGALVFEEPDGAHPVPGDVVICWDASPLGAEFTMTVTRIAPTQGQPVAFKEVVDGDNHCFFGETSAQDVPFVEFRAEARDHSGALVTAKTLRYETYQSTPAGRPPQITFVSGPASAQLDEPAVFGVFWRDPDGDAATITMTVTDAVFAGTDDPLVESRDISGIPAEEQQSGHETLFGLLCKSVDPEPRTLTFVITDSSGFTDERTALFACTS